MVCTFAASVCVVVPDLFNVDVYVEGFGWVFVCGLQASVYLCLYWPRR